ncbi:MAG: glycosyltransferase [Actinobacteria bacterium]|nr:glycosyltransferase [Actinomycetota bacterium]
MNENVFYPSITVIIPVPPGEAAKEALSSLEKINYPSEKLEIIVVEGKHPSVQRNRASKKAKGEIIYFLDSDAIVDSELFNQTIDFYKDDKIVGAGGPELSPETDTFIQKSFAYVLGSNLGCFNTRSRFASFGKPREGTEKNFILANFSIKRNVFLELDGFNEDLYPNEENEFINRLRKKDYHLIYNPQAVIYKSKRESYPDFVKQMFIYGRSRMEHVFISPFTSNLIYFIPLLFTIYLFSLIFVRNSIYILPLYLYIVLSLIFTFSIMIYQNRNPVLIFLAPALFLTIHISYGLGFFWGLVKRILRLKKRKTDSVKVLVVKELAGCRSEVLT